MISGGLQPGPLFAAAPESRPVAVRFFSFGDWGSGTQDQKDVAEATRKVCRERGCDFGLLLGDNFYNYGVWGTWDSLWKSRYQEVYQGLEMPFYALLGNHDWRGSPQAQVDYSKKDARWKMPGFYYSISYPERDPLVEIFVLNSNDFDAASQTWLRQALAASKAPWKLLAFHHPLLNTGSEHPPDQKHLWPALKPIVCGKIDAVLSGHEHLFAHLRPQNNACKYDQIILGTGGKELYDVTQVNADTLKLAAEANFGLGWMEISPHRMTLKFFRADGGNPYSYTWEK